jgi:8-oxo-dGTP diphosphatase
MANLGTAKQVVAALIVREEGILICQRRPEQTMPLKWEFPGGKVEPEEGLPAALRRELEEELGITATIGGRVAVIRHTYGGGNAVELHFYRVDYFDGELQNRIFHDVRWVEPKELASYDFLAADIAFVKKISAGEVL